MAEIRHKAWKEVLYFLMSQNYQATSLQGRYSTPGGGTAGLSLLWHREGQLWAPSGSQPTKLGDREGKSCDEDKAAHTAGLIQSYIEHLA